MKHENGVKTSYLKHERKTLYNLGMNINNSNLNTGYKNVTIRNFHIHNKFHDHENTNKHLDHNFLCVCVREREREIPLIVENKNKNAILKQIFHQNF